MNDLHKPESVCLLSIVYCLLSIAYCLLSGVEGCQLISSCNQLTPLTLAILG